MKKKNYIAIIVLVVLVGIYFLTNMNDNSEHKIFYFTNNPDSFYSIELADSTNSITLTKENDNWIMSEPIKTKIKENRIQALVKTLAATTTSSTPISESESALDNYNISNDEALKITVKNEKGNIIKESLIGRADNYNFCYARTPETNEVYLLSNNFSWSAKPDVKSWRENTVIQVAKENITHFQIANQNNNSTFTYENEKWNYSHNDITKTLEDNDIADLLNKISNLKANDFLDNPEATMITKMNNPYISLKVSASDSEDIVLNLIEYEENKDLVQIDGNNNVFYIVNKSFKEALLTEIKN